MSKGSQRMEGDRENLKREIEKRIWRFLPRKYRSALSQILEVAKDFDPLRPATSIAKLQWLLQETQRMTDVSATPLTRQQAWGLKRLLVLLRRYPFQDELRHFSHQLIRTAKHEAMRNPQASLLLKLISEADQTVSLVSICFLQTATQSLERLRPQLEPVDLFVSLESTKGEERARALVRAYRETVEWLYKPYLRLLWPLANFALKDFRPEPKAFGQLVAQLADRLKEYPGLVDAEAGWRRNGAAHGHWKYEMTGDVLIMWDDKVPARAITVEALIIRLNEMYQISGPTLERVAQLYLFRNVFGQTGLLEAFLDGLPRFLSLDQAEVAKAEKEIFAKAETAFAPLKRLLEANGYTSEPVR